MIRDDKVALIRPNSRTRTRGTNRGRDRYRTMTRGRTIGVAALLVVATVMAGAGVVAGAGQATVAADSIGAADGGVLAATNGTVTSGENTTETNTTAANATETVTDRANETIAPGARLAGVLGARQAEHRGAVETRALEIRLARAETNASEAAIVANVTERLEARIATLAGRLETLENRRENGTITRGYYLGRVTALTARIEALERMVNRTTAHARTLPEPALRAHGVPMSEIRTLANRTRRLGNPHAAAIAARVAGPAVGRPVGVPGLGPNGSVGPPGQAAGHAGPPGSAPPGQGPGRNATKTPPDQGTRGNATGVGPGNPNDPGAPNATVGPTRPGNGVNRHGSENASRGPGRTNRSDLVTSPDNRTVDDAAESAGRGRPPERGTRVTGSDRAGGSDPQTADSSQFGVLDFVVSLLDP